ncbi:MAG: SRPBCC domain-containing protein [Bacteroidetes bacterium]|nr:SRPBCC domain-containing protein [Bacteroidota bacterium]MBK9673167.1 SRPBCC domain-containing protein [Bacteroidota bacterium]MBP6413768.1 SRPBCC domain-containing protein [Bacteroidia bacterium]
MTTVASNGKAVTNKKTFSRETAVSIDIQSDKSIIWALLTNATDFPRWNSTILSIAGSIGKGEKIKLKAKLDPKREFKLTVKEFDPESKLVWGDAMGSRVYTLKTIGNNLTNFSMVEKIGGPLFPLFAKMIPPFDKAFEQFAKDLKKEAETITKTN